MNTIEFSESQTLSVWIYCLAALYHPATAEAKIAMIEQVLLTKVLDSASPVSILKTGLKAIDDAAMEYSRSVEERLRAIDLSSVSTGSPLMDEAVRGRIQKTINLNFAPLPE
jgi:hypothetical protein